MSAGASGPASQFAAMAKGMLVLCVGVLIVAGLTRACTFAPGAPEIDRESLPRVDAPSVLAGAATGVPFVVRVPRTPPDWIAQSHDVVPLGAPGDPAVPSAVRVGWVTPGNEFARLSQSDGGAGAMVLVEQGDPAPRGTIEVGGRPWTTFTGLRGELLWITEVDGVRLLVTGSAGAPELAVLAEAALAAPPVPVPGR